MDYLKANRRKLKIASIVMACVVVLATAAIVLSMVLANAATYTVDIGKYKYSLNDSNMRATVTGLSTNGLALIHADSNKVDFPETVSYDPGSGAQTFTVTNIGMNAFYTAGKGLFLEANGSYSLHLPDTLISVGAYAFRGCTGLKGNLILPNALTSIAGYAFYGCTGFNGALVIPNSVTSILANAFEGCSNFTGDLTIPNSVTTLKNNAFSGCTGFNGSLTLSNALTTIEYSTFSGCSGLTGTLTIPSSVRSIGDNAFFRCSALTGSLTIPNSVTAIGLNAFYLCTGFNGDLTLSNALTSIGKNAFFECSKLTGNPTIPSTLTTIEASVFYNCSSLTGNLTIPSSVTSIGDSAFSGCTGLNGSLTLPNTITSIGQSAFYNCSGFTGSLTIPNTLTSIEPNTFGGCSGLTGDLIIPDSVLEIKAAAFAGCTGFTGGLTLPATIVTIGDSVFHGCKGLTGNLILPNTITYIGVGAFYNCYNFTGNLILPNALTSIPESAFGLCSGFTGSLTIPSSVKSIGPGAFNSCTGFTGNLTIPGTVKKVGGSAFYNCPGFGPNLVVEEGVTLIGQSAFNVCSGINNVTIPASVQIIGKDAFNRPTAQSTRTYNWPDPIETTSLNKYTFEESNAYPDNADWMVMYNYLNGVNGPPGFDLPGVGNPFDGTQTVDGYDSVRTGDNSAGSWLYKSAKWADDEKTKADLRFDYSYISPNPGTDFVFVMDNSVSMNGDKLWELRLSALTSANSLLKAPGYDNRVSFVTFGTNINSCSYYVNGVYQANGTKNEDLDSGFYNSSQAEEALTYLQTHLAKTDGNTNYAKPLQMAYNMLQNRTDKSRQTVVIFMTDGEPNESGSLNELPGTAKDPVTGRTVYGYLQAQQLLNGNGNPGKPGYVPPTPIHSIVYGLDTIPTSIPPISTEYYVSGEGSLGNIFKDIIEEVAGATPIALTDHVHANFTIPNNANYIVKDETNNTVLAQGNLAAVSTYVTLGTATIGTSPNQQTVQEIIWNLENMPARTKYSLVIQNIDLNQVGGAYPEGALDTNADNAHVISTSGTVNQVITPVLRRGVQEEVITKLRVTKVVKNSAGVVIPLKDDDLFFIRLYDIKMNLMGSAGLDKTTPTSDWMYLEIEDETPLVLLETVPMEYGQVYTLSITDGEGNTTTVNGNSFSVNPGDELTITVTNTFQHDGFFKGKDNERNHYVPKVY